MEELKKMVRGVKNGQSALREEMLKRFNEVDKRFDKLEVKTENGFREVNKRIDKLGSQLSYL